MSLIMSSVCNRIADDLDDLINEIEDFKGTMQDSINNMVDQIKNVIAPLDPYNELILINQAIAEINKHINKIVPAIDDYYEILDIIKQCGYLQIDDFLGDPIVLVGQIEDYLKQQAMSALFNITNQIEMVVGKLIQDFINSIPTVSLNVSIPGAYQLMRCLSAMCGRDVNAYYRRFHAATERMFILPSGEFSAHSMYTNKVFGVGLDPGNPSDVQIMQNMNLSTSTIDDVYKSVQTNSDKAIEIFKDLPI